MPTNKHRFTMLLDPKLAHAFDTYKQTHPEFKQQQWFELEIRELLGELLYEQKQEQSST